MPPRIGAISATLDDPQTLESRAVTVTVVVSEVDSPATVSVAVGNRPIGSREVVPGATEVTVAGDLPGGETYTVAVTAVDDDGNESVATHDLGYVAEPTTPVDPDRLVGVHYYSWWGSGWHWNKGYDGTPELGRYDSRDPAVIEQHLDWLREAGVNWLSLSWYGRDSWSGETIENHLMEAPGIGDFSVSILYETQSQLEQRPNGWVTDFDVEANRERFASDVAYLAETYFSRDNYLHLDGRPVLYPYVSSGFVGDFAGALREAERRIGQDVYVLGDFPFQKWPPSKASTLEAFDGVANYSGFYQPVANIDELVPRQPRRKYTEWLLRTRRSDLAFVPTLTPGFDKTSHDAEESKELPVLDGSPERFAAWCEATRGLLDPEVNAVLLTSFNEWHEGTQLEPGTDYGTALLDVVESRVSSPAYLHRNLDAVGSIVLEPERTVAEHEVNPDQPKERSRELAFTLAAFELRNTETGWREEYSVAPGPDAPFFVEGVFAYNPDWERRWCGGSSRRAVFGVDREAIRAADVLRVRCAPQPSLGELAVTGGLEGGRAETRNFLDGSLREYEFPLEPV